MKARFLQIPPWQQLALMWVVGVWVIIGMAKTAVWVFQAFEALARAI
jgi:hypothetical protein